MLKNRTSRIVKVDGKKVRVPKRWLTKYMTKSSHSSKS